MKNINLIGLVLTLIVSITGPSFADDSSLTPEVILEGLGVLDMAPHGGGNVYAPCVLADGGLLKMWYGGQGKDGHDRIFYAESKDGHTWDRKSVVLKDDSANHVNDPCVLKVDGRYFMFFTHTKTDVIERIDVATSNDGLNWDVRGTALAPAEPGAWDSLSVGRPAVIYEDGLFKMWFDGRKNFPPNSPVKNVPFSDNSQRHVGYATSKDGVHWDRHTGNPVFGHDAGGIDVKRVGKTLVMLVESREGTRLATSRDGIGWTDRGVFVPRSGKDLDAFGHVTPFLLLDEKSGVDRLYFGASSAETWDHNKIAVVQLAKGFVKQCAEGK